MAATHGPGLKLWRLNHPTHAVVYWQTENLSTRAVVANRSAIWDPPDKGVTCPARFASRAS